MFLKVKGLNHASLPRLNKEELRPTPFVFDDLIVVQRGGEYE